MSISTRAIRNYLEDTFNFEVEKRQLHHNIGLKKFYNQYEPVPYYGLFRSDNGEPVSSTAVSERYEPHQTKHIVDVAVQAAAGFAYETEKIQAYFNNGHYVSISPNNDYRARIKRSARDYVWPRILISAGLGGKSSVKIQVGYWRDACANLAMPRIVKGISINFRHSSTINERLKDIDMGDRLYGMWVDLNAKMCEMDDKEFNLVEALATIFPPTETQREAAIATTRNAAIIQRMITDNKSVRTDRLSMNDPINVMKLQEEVNTVTGWDLYNAIQGYYQHNAPMRSVDSLNIIGYQELSTEQHWSRMLKTMKNQYVTATENYVLSA